MHPALLFVFRLKATHLSIHLVLLIWVQEGDVRLSDNTEYVCIKEPPVLYMYSTHGIM